MRRMYSATLMTNCPKCRASIALQTFGGQYSEVYQGECAKCGHVWEMIDLSEEDDP